MKLRQTFASEVPVITRMAWSPDGTQLAAGCGDDVVRVFDMATGATVELRGHAKIVSAVSWSPDGRMLASGSADQTIRVWSVADTRVIATLRGHEGFVRAVEWVGPGKLVSGGEDDTLRSWDVTGSGTQIHMARLSGGWVLSIAVSRTRPEIAVGSGNGRISLWNPHELVTVSKNLRGHKSWIDSLAWSPDGRRLLSASGDKTVRMWDPIKGKQLGIIEGHTEQVRAVAFSADGGLLASKADDGTVRLCDAATWQLIAKIDEAPGHSYWPPGIAFHPRLPILATVGERICLWDIDVPALDDVARGEKSVRYIVAKIALVGDSGVGKTSLGWRLTHREFKPQPSTHGQQFWVVDDLRMTRGDGAQCEAVLWDFAGQPDYRIVHALFMDDVQLALVLFDATANVEGVRYWLKHLSREKTRIILVAARSDRGSPVLTRAELDAFCEAEGVQGGLVAVSARSGEGLPALLDRIRSTIAWDSMPATVTTATFKRIKEYMLRLKETSPNVLIGQAELAQRIRADDPQSSFTDAELATTVTHLATHGYVSVVRSSDGRELILLAPELLANVASSLVLEARANEKELGAIDERRVLRGEVATRGTEQLSTEDRIVLINAAVVLFLRHNICFRQTVDTDTLLIFPALINQKPPLLAPDDIVEFMTYRISGAVENVYAALVVQLGYTGAFKRTNQWQNQAEYETLAGAMCGFRQTAESEGEIEMVLYHSKRNPGGRPLFQVLFETFLATREVVVRKFGAAECGRCGDRPDRSEIIRRVNAGKTQMFCSECGYSIALAEDGGLAGGAARRPVVRAAVDTNERRNVYEQALVSIKATRAHAQGMPSCFISYARGDERHSGWMADLTRDLQDAGIEVLIDTMNKPGTVIIRFMEEAIRRAGFIALIGTPLYGAKYRNQHSPDGSILAAEVDAIQRHRVLRTDELRATVLPLLREGTPEESLPPLVLGMKHLDFRQPEQYFAELFDLVLTIYGMPFTRPEISGLRDEVRGGIRPLR